MRRAMTEKIVSSEDRKGKFITDVSQLPIILSIPVMSATGAGSAPYLRKLCREGKLPATKLGSDWRVSKAAFCEYFNLVQS